MQEQIHQLIELAHSGQCDKALQIARDILAKDPSQAAAWKWLAYLAPDPHEALYTAQQLQALSPDDPWLESALPALRARASGSDDAPRARHTEPGTRPGWSPAVYTALIGLLVVGVVALTLILSEQIAPRSGAGAIVAASEAEASPARRLFSGGRVSRLSRLDPVRVSLIGGADGASSTAVLIPEVVEQTDTRFYTFEASTEEEIRAAVYNDGPTLKSGQKSIAMTSYQIWVQWKARQSASACQMTEAVVNLNVTYTLPQWIPTGDPPDILFEQWEHFYDYVASHEEHHGLLARDCADYLVEQLKQLESQPTCTGIENAINELVDEAYAYCEELQTAFDLEFGRTSFPLPEDR